MCRRDVLCVCVCVCVCVTVGCVGVTVRLTELSWSSRDRYRLLRRAAHRRESDTRHCKPSNPAEACHLTIKWQQAEACRGTVTRHLALNASVACVA